MVMSLWPRFLPTLYIWIYITNCIFVLSKFFTWVRFKRHYALPLAIAPEFFIVHICAAFVCSGLLE